MTNLLARLRRTYADDDPGEFDSTIDAASRQATEFGAALKTPDSLKGTPLGNRLSGNLKVLRSAVAELDKSPTDAAVEADRWLDPGLLGPSPVERHDAVYRAVEKADESRKAAALLAARAKADLAETIVEASSIPIPSDVSADQLRNARDLVMLEVQGLDAGTVKTGLVDMAKRFASAGDLASLHSLSEVAGPLLRRWGHDPAGFAPTLASAVRDDLARHGVDVVDPAELSAVLSNASKLVDATNLAAYYRTEAVKARNAEKTPGEAYEDDLRRREGLVRQRTTR